MKRHPNVHPHNILDDLYHTPMHSAQRSPTQNGIARRRMRRNSAGAEPPQMHADVSAGRSVWGARAAGDWTGGGTVFEEDDEILRGVEGKVLEPHTEVVHD